MNKVPRRLSLSNLNPGCIKFQYAVRGAIVTRAYELKQQLENSPKSLPFTKIYMCNVGNPQELGQVPVTFIRQVLSIVLNPALLKSSLLPKDAKRRAEDLLKPNGSLGAYTHSQGLEAVRKSVVNFLEKRDGLESSVNDIFLTNGATQAIKRTLQMLIRNKKDGIMVPVPQYPLYSATIDMFGGKMIGYQLEEDADWDINVEELEEVYQSHINKGVTPRALCVINPGNPTGQVLRRDRMEELIAFAHRHGIVLLADEVYQDNIYDEGKPFVSFRKVLGEMGEEFQTQELFSFDSVSKGLLGECGMRGGFVETKNVAPEVKAVYLKMASCSLCPNVLGQIAVELKSNPPLEGDESYQLYQHETSSIYKSLRRRADKISKGLEAERGISCRRTAGALYAFPKLELPERAVSEARKNGQEPDAFYCLKMLEETGICTVPGSGFAQKDGTFHLRITILPPEDEFDHVLRAFSTFHREFLAKYE